MGYLVVGDIHNEIHYMRKVVDYAVGKDLEVIFVGDLVDYGPAPAEVILLANSLSNAQFVEGNHDNKIYRYTLGNDVEVMYTMDSTVQALQDPDVADAWQQLYEKMTSHIVIGDTHITHAGFSPEYWEGDIDSKKTKRTYLYGETDKTKPFIERFGQLYPHRSYNWTGAIPDGKTVIVGHDRSPFQEEPAFDSNINSIVVSTNNLGGKVVFTDTGAGKGGFVSGVELDDAGEIVQFISFEDET